MFCNQCEEASKGVGCDVMGVCGKSAESSDVMDNLIYGLQGVSLYANEARALGAVDDAVNKFTIEGLFSTLTNVNFDSASLAAINKECGEIKAKAKGMYETAYKEKNGGAAAPNPGNGQTEWTPGDDLAAMARQGQAHGLKELHSDDDIRSAMQILIYGLKGVAAYADHALVLGVKDDEVFAFIHKALAATTDKSLGLNDFVGLLMECGKVNLKAMENLNNAHTSRFGHPVPTKVSLGTKAGKAILISGHDLVDLEELLKQTEGKGINIYTHGEMLPAHGYPGLKKYAHFAGHFGGAWQLQQKEFAAFPGSILMTTNCIKKPKDTYINNIFTTGVVEFPGVKHVGQHDFAAVIARAQELPGFETDAAGQEILVGFGHNAVLGVADKVIAAVKSGAIKRFFLIGGCDGAKPGRNYFTEFAEQAPADTVILTLACGKFRFNTHEFGDIGGIPRLLDVGQCNDAYSAVQIAVALAGAFECGVNDLPLSIILSWYEQKAVSVLLTLLSLGIKNIKLGPTLPAFITPNVLNFLVEQFNIGPVTTVEADMAAALA